MKETTLDISVIIPVHELNEETKKMFSNAVESVKQQTVKPEQLLVVAPKNSETLTFIKSFDFGTFKNNVTILENDGETDFASQINFAVENCKTEWFSILEFDDEYANIWFKNVLEYKNAYPDVQIFMPIIIDVDTSNQFVGFTNEAVWAQGFCDEMGVLDNNSLLAYQNFNIDGMVIKKSVYDSFGGFKPSIKLTFVYEFLLRMTFKSVKVMVIPKFGYKHVNQRKGSLFSNYKETIDPVEARWWLSQAKREYYFTKDRNITYQKENA